MSRATDIPSDRATRQALEAYESAEYRISARDNRLSFVLKAGERSPELKRLFDETGTGTAAFLSAWNPDDEEDEEELSRK